jgi:hypothetical protein
MNANEIAQLLWQNESNTLDFKRDQYPFDGATDEQRSELVKDVLAFANAWRSTSAHILIGVEEVKHARSIPVGTEHLINRSLQTFVNSKVNRPITFSYDAYEIESKSIGVLEIPVQDRPLYLTKKYGRLEANTVYIRRGDTTDIATPDEIAQMGMKREQANNHPVLAFSLGNLDKRSKLHGTLRVETTCYSVPKSKALPRYGTDNIMGMSMNNENENYYVDVAHYLQDVPHLQEYAVVIANDSRTTAQQVVVRIRFSDPDLEVLSPRERRAEPARDRFMKIMPKVLPATEISVDRGDAETIAKIELGDIQPGTEEWSRHSFYLGSRVSKAFEAVISVSAHNLGEPMQLSQSFDFEVASQPVSVEQVIAFGDDL